METLRPNHIDLSHGFNTIPSEVLFGVYEARRTSTRPSLVYCGDDKASKAVAAELIRDVGFDPLDVGPLRIARYTRSRLRCSSPNSRTNVKEVRNWLTRSSGLGNRVTK